MGWPAWDPLSDRGDDRGKKVTVRLSAEEHSQLKQLASQTKVPTRSWYGGEQQATLSDVIRLALTEFVPSRLTPSMLDEPKAKKQPRHPSRPAKKKAVTT